MHTCMCVCMYVCRNTHSVTDVFESKTSVTLRQKSRLSFSVMATHTTAAINQP
jgi:hypothetical protein